MGIFINIALSKSVTRKEWEEVYQETLQLVKAFPLAERREVSVQGIPTMCLVRTEEREEQWGWLRRETRRGWFADGDYEYLCTAENYFLPCNLVTEDQYEENAPDAMLASLPAYLEGYDWNDDRFGHCYSLWGAKTQGEPYHMYLLSIACLIESRLGRKAYVYGDITKGQCERAVRMANAHLEQKIHTPDRCDKERLFARVADLSLTETEQLRIYACMYLGRRDAEFGTSVRDYFSNQACDEYWENRFKGLRISTMGFNKVIKEYLLWGFGLKEMCSFVRFIDDDGESHYKDFVKVIMDAQLHHRNKDCTDMLEIDPDEERPYGIDILFAQLALGGARNRKIDRYIPIEQIRSELSHAIGDRCPVDKLIDACLQEEDALELPDLFGETSEEDIQKVAERDPSYVLTEVLRKRQAVLKEDSEKYDISESEDLPYYEAGDTVHPGLMDVVGESLAFYRGLLAEDGYLELMAKSPEERCLWLARTNRCLLLRDKDWEKIYADIVGCPESFGRYYPMVRVKADSEELRCMVRAFVINDALYSYASELTSGLSDDD